MIGRLKGRRTDTDRRREQKTLVHCSQMRRIGLNFFFANIFPLFPPDLRQLFMLLIRTCPLAGPYKIYLRDVVTTNHVYLLLVEHLLSKSESMNFCPFVCF